jgi:hypothetical protein
MLTGHSSQWLGGHHHHGQMTGHPMTQGVFEQGGAQPRLQKFVLISTKTCTLPCGQHDDVGMGVQVLPWIFEPLSALSMAATPARQQRAIT